MTLVAAPPYAPNRRAGANAGGAWLFPDYQRRVAVTIQSSQVDSTLTNFPVFIDYALMPSTFHDNVQADTDDVRAGNVAHDTEHPIDNVTYDSAADDGEGWTCIPSISSSVDTVFYVYYDYASASAYGTPEDVWDSTGANYMGVWHLNAAGNATQPAANGVSDMDLTPSNMESGDSVACLLGNCVHLDGSNEFLSRDFDLTIFNNNFRPDTTFAFSAWLNQDVTTSDDMIGGHLDSTTKGYALWKYNSQSNFRPTVGNGTGNAWSNLNEPTSGKSTGTWYHMAVTWNGSTARLYWDGTEVDTYPLSGSFQWSNQPFFVGKRPSGNYWDGKIDEVHLHDDELSAAWIKAEYINQKTPGTFYTIGVEETQ